MKIYIRLLLITLLLVFALSSCSSSESYEADNQEYNDYEPTAYTNDSNITEADDSTPNYTTEPAHDYADIYYDEVLTSPPRRQGREWLHAPYLIRLTPFTSGSYTDGQNTYIITDDGTVLVNAQLHGSTIFTLDNMQNTTPNFAAFYDSEELLKAEEIVAYNMHDRWWGGNAQIIYANGDTFYLHFNHTNGGGSGESFYHRSEAFFFKVNTRNGEFKDFGEIGAVHIIWHNGYFYYMDLIGGMPSTPGTGRIMRMDMDGANKTVIVDEITVGPFSIGNGKIFFSSLANGITYSVNLDGSGKLPVCERIAPRNHRAWLEFHGNTIINRAWQHIGYSFGIFVLPSNLSHPAIMCLEGCCLVTFPNELRGDDPFRVINWGYYDYETWWHDRPFFMVLQSNLDGSYWVYSRRCSSGF